MNSWCFQEASRKQDEAERIEAAVKRDYNDYKHDVNVLINVIHSARTHGRWTTEDTRFRALTHEQVFGTYEPAKRYEFLEGHLWWQNSGNAIDWFLLLKTGFLEVD